MRIRTVFIAAILSTACTDPKQSTPERQAEVAERGAAVMPFDLDKTKHHFEALHDGGLQTVTANDPADTAQIALIQGHLKKEAANFSRGMFDDPAAIHGHDMPGLAELKAGASKIRVEYDPENDGGRIRYTTTEPALVDALHRWFDAQRMDHGKHAQD
ncbi:MAG: aspartate carbamoyltransferase [Gemmatimonadales bacterium]|nr:aspartate carbamoyltransferase [Gemmatimonadales bacterium]